MRRNDKQIHDSAIIAEILEKSELCRIAMVDNGEPYIVPLNFGYKDNIIYTHSAPIGRKIEILQRSNRVCFEILFSNELIPGDKACNWGAKFRSIIGYGEVQIITESERKKSGLDIIMSKYGGAEKNSYDEKPLEKTVVLEITIESMTAKQSGKWA